MNTNPTPPQKFFDEIWTNGLEPEIIDFLHSLNWFYIIMFINILYGLKYTGQFNWYERMFKESKLKPYKIWITALVLALVHTGFVMAEPTLEVSVKFFSSLLRSIMVAVIFSGIFVDIPALLIKRFREFLEPKDDQDDTPKKK